MGHVNNAIYLTYAEEARIIYFEEFLGKNWNWKKNGIILRKHEIEYLKPIHFDNEIEIETKIEKINKKTIEISHIFRVNSIETTKVKSILVYFDYEKNTSKKLDYNILSKLIYE